MLVRTPIKSNTTTIKYNNNHNNINIFPRWNNNPLDNATHSARTTTASSLRSVAVPSIPQRPAIVPVPPVLCHVTPPVVRVDQLTYDWSSLPLDGTRAWNAILEHHHHHHQRPTSPQNGDTKEHPSVVTPLHLYQLMQLLKEALLDSIVVPSPDCPLQSIHDTERNDDDLLYVSSTNGLEPNPPDNCPEELLPLYNNAAIFYRKLLEERRNFHHQQHQLQHQADPQSEQQKQQHPSLKDTYQLMDANELCQYVQQTKKHITSLYRKEQRVLNTAKQLFLYPPRNGNHPSPNLPKETSLRPSPPSMRNPMFNDEEIRTRYNQHFWKRHAPHVTTTTQTNGTANGSTTTATSTTNQKLLWQDDDISTLLKKR